MAAAASGGAISQRGEEQGGSRWRQRAASLSLPEEGSLVRMLRLVGLRPRAESRRAREMSLRGESHWFGKNGLPDVLHPAPVFTARKAPVPPRQAVPKVSSLSIYLPF